MQVQLGDNHQRETSEQPRTPPWGYTWSLLAGFLLVCGGLSHTARANYDVVIDPGHGGSDPGAVGCGIQEAAAALTVAYATYGHLQRAGLKVEMTRYDNTTVSLQGRVAYAREHRAKLFLSIHLNAHTNPSANGTETFHDRSGKSADRRFAERAQERQLYALGLRDRGVKTANFYVLTNSSMPAILAELGFLSNCNGDARLLREDAHLKNAGTALAHAALQQLGLPIDHGQAQPAPTPTPSTPAPTPVPVPSPPVAQPQPEVPMVGLLKGVIYRDRGLGAEDTSERLAGAVVSFGGSASAVTSQGNDGSWETTLRSGQHSIFVAYEGQNFGPVACTVLAGMTNWCVIGLGVESGAAAEVPMIDPEPGPSSLSDPRAMDLVSSAETSPPVFKQGTAGGPQTACAVGQVDSGAHWVFWLWLGVVLWLRQRAGRRVPEAPGLYRPTAYPMRRPGGLGKSLQVGALTACLSGLLLGCLSLGIAGCKSGANATNGFADNAAGSESESMAATGDPLSDASTAIALRQRVATSEGVSPERVASVVETLRKQPRMHHIDRYLPRATVLQATTVATRATPRSGPPVIAPSGLEVLLTDTHLAGLEVWTLSTGSTVTLTEREGAGFRPSFSGDGQTISYRIAGQSAYAVPFFHVDKTGQPVSRERTEPLRVRQHEDRVEVWNEGAWEPVVAEARGHIVEVSVAASARWLAYRHFGEGYIIRDLDHATAYALGDADDLRFAACGDRFVFAQTEEDGQVHLSSTFYLMDAALGPTSLRRIALPEGAWPSEEQASGTLRPEVCAENSPCEPEALPLFPSLDCSGKRLAYVQGNRAHVVALDNEAR